MQELGGQDGTIDARQLRNALGRFATGVTVVTTRTPRGKLEGLTANSFSALSLDPPLVLWSLRQGAPSLESFLRAGRFTINVLAAEQWELSRRFATPRPDKFEEVGFSSGLGGCPVLTGSLATFECETQNTVEGGDHLIFLGRVLRTMYREGEPLLFSGGRYCVPALLPVRSDGDVRLCA